MAVEGGNLQDNSPFELAPPHINLVEGIEDLPKIIEYFQQVKRLQKVLADLTIRASPLVEDYRRGGCNLEIEEYMNLFDARGKASELRKHLYDLASENEPRIVTLGTSWYRHLIKENREGFKMRVGTPTLIKHPHLRCRISTSVLALQTDPTHYFFSTFDPYINWQARLLGADGGSANLGFNVYYNPRSGIATGRLKDPILNLNIEIIEHRRRSVAFHSRLVLAIDGSTIPDTRCFLG